MASLVVQCSESLPTNHEVPGSITGSTVGIFSEREDSHGDHGLGSLVEFRFKGPPCTTSPISPLTSSGQRNRASWVSQPQKSVTLLPCPGGKTTKPVKDMWGIGGKKIYIQNVTKTTQSAYMNDKKHNKLREINDIHTPSLSVQKSNHSTLEIGA